MRKIPTVMISQHPDNASKPYWHTKAYISDQYEVKECFLAFSKLDADEYKWDWEGKFVDESVFERLINEYYTFFQKRQLGKDKFLTFRLPNFRVDTEFRLGRSLIGIATAAGLAKRLGLHSPPIFEVILPMTQTALEMIGVQEAFKEIAKLSHPYFKNGALKHIEIIPLFEQIDTLIDSSDLLEKYLRLHRERFGFMPIYLRPYIARSDTALSAGIVPSVLAIKIALSRYKMFERRTGVNLYPILGAGSLPFRGGITPLTIREFSNEYRGIRTVLVQSAFQYDFEHQGVIDAIAKLKKILPKSRSWQITPVLEKILPEIISIFSSFYQKTVCELAPLLWRIATFIPPRRERLKHIGFFKYHRMLKGVKIPRAIDFTASLYSIGIPPELIGTGRGIAKIKKHGRLDVLETAYLGIRRDLDKAGRYLNKRNLKDIARKSRSGHEILEDIKAIENYLGYELCPVTDKEKAHRIFTDEIYDRFINATNISNLIQEAAILRNSLG